MQTIEIFFSECIVAKDCPNGGTNYECNANLCECPLVLDNDNCVGKLLFDKEILHRYIFK